MYFEEIQILITEAWQLSKLHFVNTEKRIFIPYLFSAALIAYFIFKKNQSKKSFISYLFDKRIWASKSAFIDYSLFLLNNFIKVSLIAPYLIFGLYIAFYINENLALLFGVNHYSLSLTQTIIFYTISLTIFNDLLSYIVHYLMHKIPVLWEFHKVHHSAETLNPITQYRVHPFELILNNVKSIIGFGVVTGIFDYLSNHQVDKLVFLGANIFTFLFMLLGANLRHSHVKFKYPSLLEHIFISPFQHQIHHSKNIKHHNKNMGSKLAIWDYLFGTLELSKNNTQLRFGLSKSKNKYNSFWKTLITPFNYFLKTSK